MVGGGPAPPSIRELAGKPSGDARRGGRSGPGRHRSRIEQRRSGPHLDPAAASAPRGSSPARPLPRCRGSGTAGPCRTRTPRPPFRPAARTARLPGRQCPASLPGTAPGQELDLVGPGGPWAGRGLYSTGKAIGRRAPASGPSRNSYPTSALPWTPSATERSRMPRSIRTPGRPYRRAGIRAVVEQSPLGRGRIFRPQPLDMDQRALARAEQEMTANAESGIGASSSSLRVGHSAPPSQQLQESRPPQAGRRGRW